MAPAPVMSQTSLPSQTGPIEARITLLSASVLLEERVEHAGAQIEAVEDHVHGEQERRPRKNQMFARVIASPPRAGGSGPRSVGRERLGARLLGLEHPGRVLGAFLMMPRKIRSQAMKSTR